MAVTVMLAIVWRWMGMTADRAAAFDANGATALASVGKRRVILLGAMWEHQAHWRGIHYPCNTPLASRDRQGDRMVS
jgi:hypothetical protein